MKDATDEANLSLLLRQLNRADLDAAREQKTQVALKTAKEALIAYATWIQWRPTSFFLSDLRSSLAFSQGQDSGRGNLLGIQPELRDARILDEPALDHVPAHRALQPAQQEDPGERQAVALGDAAAQQEPEERQQNHPPGDRLRADRLTPLRPDRTQPASGGDFGHVGLGPWA